MSQRFINHRRPEETLLEPVATVAELRLVAVGDTQDKAMILCEGTGNIYRYDYESVDVDNGSTIIQPTAGVGAWLAILGAATSTGDQILDDNEADAWQIREGTNTYVGFVTTDGAEVIQLGDNSEVPTLSLVMEAGTGGWSMDSAGTGIVDVAGVLEFNSSGGAISIGNDDVDQNINIGTDGDRTINIGVGDGATATNIFAGTGGLTISSAGDLDIALADNTAGAWTLAEGANSYHSIDTTDGSEAMTFGNATTNPTFGFLGSGQGTFSGPVDFDGAVTLTGTASYSQTVGAFTFNVSGSNFSVTGNDITLSAAGGAANSVRIEATGTGGGDFDFGSNGWTVDSTGSMILTGPDDTATMWQVKEGLNSYLRAISTNGSEQVEIGENLLTLKDTTVYGEAYTRMAVPSGNLMTIGGQAYVQDVTSNVIANSTLELAFNKSYTFPVNSLTPGRRLIIRAAGFVIETAGGADIELRIRLDDGTTSWELAYTNKQVNDLHIWELEVEFLVYAGGTQATRDFVAFSGGTAGAQVSGATGTPKMERRRLVNSADLDTTAPIDITVTAQWAVADVNHQVQMDLLSIDLR